MTVSQTLDRGRGYGLGRTHFQRDYRRAPPRRWSWCGAVVFYLAFLLSSAGAKIQPQSEYPACPSNWDGTRSYCCASAEGNQVFTLYVLPDAEEEQRPGAEYYREAWSEARQINFPYSKYSPDTPEFVYAPESVCRLDPYTQQVVCRPELPPENSSYGDHFFTYTENARNNNATCTGSLLRIPEDIALEACQEGVLRPLVEPRFSAPFTQPLLLFAYATFALACLLPAVWAGLRERLGDAAAAAAAGAAAPDKHGADGAPTPWAKASMAGLLPRGSSFAGDGAGGGIGGGPSTPVLTGRPSAVRSSYRMSDTAEPGPGGAGAAPAGEDPAEDLTQHGLRNHLAGSLVLAYVGLMSLLFFVWVLLIILDYYAIFDPPLFDPARALLVAMIVVWTLMAVWFIGLVVFHQRIRNFFRVDCPLAVCAFVDIFKPDADEVLLVDRSGVTDFVRGVEARLGLGKRKGFRVTVPVRRSPSGTRYIEFQCMRYAFSPVQGCFVPNTVEVGSSLKQLKALARGLDTSDVRRRLEQVGPNGVDIHMPTMVESLVQEFFTFFYVYQVMCYLVWFYFAYYNLAAVMVTVVLCSAIISIVTKRSLQRSVILMTQYSTDCEVLRDGAWTSVSSRDLVPGDCLRVRSDWTIPCDLVLAEGNVVCDESSLTGESMPVQKFAAPDDQGPFQPLGSGKKHTLFAGTKALETDRAATIGIVYTTGVHTSKGQLIQNILFPIPIRFKYDEHLKVVIVVLLVFAVIAATVVVMMLTSNDNLSNKLSAWCYGVFVLSGLVSPLLPVVLVVGQAMSAQRLRALGVTCLNPQRIALSGKVRIMCFDKTGTLTKEGLEFIGVLPCQNANFAQDAVDVTQEEVDKPVLLGLASCHALSRLGDKVVGNEVERNMFASTGWTIHEESGSNELWLQGLHGEKLQVLHRFEFDHRRMSMSVLVRDSSDGAGYVYCKGSYEKVLALSRPASRPHDFTQRAEGLAKEGCYVLGLCWRKLKPEELAALDTEKIERDQLESDLDLLGLLLYRNELKADTSEALGRLRAGDVRSVMITGDNALCGYYIAKKSGMLREGSRTLLGTMEIYKRSSGAGDAARTLRWRSLETDEEVSKEQMQAALLDERVELALTGEAFDHLRDTGEMDDLLLRTRIFSRMTPQGKVSCVHMHMEKGAMVGMCGDGGNDCGALRASHVGIALSDSDASVVSPFSSSSKTVTSVVDLMREGRCALTTSFGSVKFLVQFGLISTCARFFASNYAVVAPEMMCVLLDGFTLVGLSYFITRARPLPELGSQRPTSSLVGPTTVVSVLGQQAINVAFLFAVVGFLFRQPWYCPFDPKNTDLAKWWLLGDNALTTVLYLAIPAQEQAAALVFSLGGQFRRPLWRNSGLCVYYALLLTLNVLLMTLPAPNPLADLLRTASSTNVVGLPDMTLPTEFRVQLLIITLANTATVLAFEKFVVLGPVRNAFRRKYHHDVLPMTT